MTYPVQMNVTPEVQVNMRAGEVPTDPDGRPMLKVPINGL